MHQLKFNTDFTEILSDLIKPWKEKSDIPNHILNFISEISNARAIFERKTQLFYCTDCLKPLNNFKYCDKCQKQYCENNKDGDRIWLDDLKELKDVDQSIDYYAFDIINKEIILYKIEERITFDNRLILMPRKLSSLKIECAYYIERDGITNLIDDKNYLFYELDKQIIEPNEEGNYDLEILFTHFTRANYLYVDNLKELENTIYKYSAIWKLSEFLKSINIKLAMLTYFPLHFPEFEYLVKMKLFTLACFDSHKIKFKGNFYETFNLDKSYLPFMIENDINYEELKAINLSGSKDLSLIRFVSSEVYLFEDLNEMVKLDFKKLESYFNENNVFSEKIFDYYDYIRYANELGLNLKDSNVVFPKNLSAEHDKLLKQIYTANDPKINDRIKAIADKLRKYEIEDYIIYPASSIEELIDESSQQNNCVRTYCERYSDNKCQIYFMRKKETPEKSFVTIEVQNHKIVQARTKYNESPEDNIKQIIEKWEKEVFQSITEK